MNRATFHVIHYALLFAGMVLLFPAGRAPASTPVREKTVTGCVRTGQLFIAQSPTQPDRVTRYRIKPCTNTPFDFQKYEGKLVKATGGLDIRNGLFVCPKNVSIRGDCPQAAAAGPAGKGEADRLWAEGQALQGKGELTAAFDKFQQSILYGATPERLLHVYDMETWRAEAERLGNEGYGLHQAGRVDEALAKYKEALSWWPDARLGRYIKEVEGVSASNSVPTPSAAGPAAITKPIETPRPIDKTEASVKSVSRATISGREAEEIIWGLNDVKSMALKIRKAGGRSFTMVESDAKSVARFSTGAAIHIIYFGEDHRTHTVRLATFLVDAHTKEVKVYDTVTDRVMPLEEWKKTGSPR